MPPKSKKETPKPKSQPPDQPKPNWPPFRPLIPPSDLSLESLLHEQIYLIRNFLPSSLCKTYASFLASLPLTTTPGKPKKGEAVRVNDRFQVQDADFAERLWSGTALRELVSGAVDEDEDGDGRPRSKREIWGGEPLGLNANIRIYRYSKGQFFAQHYDDSNVVTFESPQHKPQQARTTWTLLVYLTSCTGGETVFYPEPTRANRNPEPIAVAPEVGMALLHRHGERCLLHEGREVTDGEKWVLRSDLVVAR
ncbi:hypothetical protein CNMCM6805_007794 [Aspergillus fumigatiaffinis]|jgi:hypothetical protein|uniref:Fe2OG dioxygenase domain-containing protein n=1 Tax=Aspergillus fumigatiaffinis TaxID=340414 RepID=A0A8H4MAG4_9EURO|nr:hypothetical protein CNMCM5878_001816 [Aspergillus fumigatiaffinis]KAF4223427.1 hypothetical protein CNMCM6457_000304 [Aspergillus fumigatiaffinis]KAF4235859.1 hypothetical protein CNMCM6805_007794 [Aspergillus fumigatiaffinis]